MGFPKGQKRDFNALQRRRLKAATLFDKGLAPAEVARQLGVSCQSASRWRQAWEQAGKAALKKAAKAGRRPRLQPQDLPALKRALKAGPGEHGFPTELWTTQRIAKVMETLFGIKYHPDHVGRLLGQIGWSCQRPTTRALQRNKAAIRRWQQETWPALKKKALKEDRIVVFIDESGLSQKPHRVRTWAPCGQTPVLEFDFNWKKLSVIGGITVWNFYFQLYPGAIKSPQVIAFLQHLQQQLPGKLLIIWDGAMIHRSRLVREYLESLQGRIYAAALPAYAPELNPAEYVWGYFKQHRLPNFTAKDIAHLGAFGRRQLRNIRRRPKLIAAFWKQAELW